MTALPLIFRWDGEAMVPHGPRWAKEADKQFVVGELYRLIPHEERSIASHNGYFAALNETWRSLPEKIADDFPSVEHLRKWALIRAGFATETKMVFKTNAEAVAAAAFVGSLDGYAICQVTDRLVTVWVAESQSMKAMDKERFKQSKEAVLRVVSELIDADASKASEAA